MPEREQRGILIHIMASFVGYVGFTLSILAIWIGWLPHTLKPNLLLLWGGEGETEEKKPLIQSPSPPVRLTKFPSILRKSSGSRHVSFSSNLSRPDPVRKLSLDVPDAENTSTTTNLMSPPSSPLPQRPTLSASPQSSSSTLESIASSITKNKQQYVSDVQSTPVISPPRPSLSLSNQVKQAFTKTRRNSGTPESQTISLSPIQDSPPATPRPSTARKSSLPWARSRPPVNVSPDATSAKPSRISFTGSRRVSMPISIHQSPPSPTPSSTSSISLFPSPTSKSDKRRSTPVPVRHRTEPYGAPYFATAPGTTTPPLQPLIISETNLDDSRGRKFQNRKEAQEALGLGHRPVVAKRRSASASQLIGKHI